MNIRRATLGNVNGLVQRLPDLIRHGLRVLARSQSVGVRALVLDPDNRILLIRHTYRSGWATPGGAVNAGETPSEAILREVFEETGLTVSTAPVLFAVYQNRFRGLDDFPILFVIREQQGTPQPVDLFEIAEAAWFPLDDLPSDTTPATRARISEFRGEKPVSDNW